MHLHFYDPKRRLKSAPLAFFLHSHEGNARMSFGADINLLSERGYACVSLEAPYSRARNSVQPRGLLSARNEHCLWDQTVEELAMGLEEAMERWNCDPARLAFVGQNIGGCMGAFWIAKGAPIRAAVFTGCHPSLTDYYLCSDHSAAVEARAVAGADPADFEERMRETDLLETVPRLSHTETLIQFGSEDPYISAADRARAEIAFSGLPAVRVATVSDDHEMHSLGTVRARVRFLEDALSGDGDRWRQGREPFHGVHSFKNP